MTAVGALKKKINEVAPYAAPHPADVDTNWAWVAAYNDLDEITLEDMINVFDKAIIGLEEKGE